MEKAPKDAAKDQKLRLLLVGVMDILLGLATLLMGLLMVLAPLLAPNKPENSQIHYGAAAALYFVLALGFIVLGVGLLDAKRWARALALVIGWIWLLLGIGSMALMLYLCVSGTFSSLVTTMQPGKTLPDNVMDIFLWVMLGIVSVIYILIPGLQVMGLQSQSVKETCERRDPVVRWTDHCPLPVLAIVLIQLLGGFYLLAWPFFYGPVFPVFGVILEGIPAALLLIGISIFLLWTAWESYQLKLRAWQLILGSQILWILSATLTFSQINIMDFYQKLNFSPEQLSSISKVIPLMGGPFLVYLGFAMLGFLGYWIYCRKFFVEAL